MSRSALLASSVIVGAGFLSAANDICGQNRCIADYNDDGPVDGSDVGRVALYDTSGNMVTPGLGAITAAGSISAGSGFALNQSSIGGYWSADPTYGIFSFSGGWRWLWQRSNGNLFWQNTSGTNLLTVANDGSVTANGSVTATAAVNAMSDLYFGFSQQSTTRLQSFGNTWYWAWNTANGDLSWNGGGTSRWVMRVSDGLAYNNMNAVAGYGAYINLSDASVKTDIADASHGLQQILQLQPKTFRRKARSNDFEHDLELGFVAQDVQAVLPHAVRQANFADEPLLGLTLDPIVAALVNSIKTMAAQIAELKAARA